MCWIGVPVRCDVVWVVLEESVPIVLLVYFKKFYCDIAIVPFDVVTGLFPIGCVPKVSEDCLSFNVIW